jgi:hypothetical protein
MITDPLEAINAIIGKRIVGFHVEDDIVTIVLDHGEISFEGDDFDCMISVDEIQ